MQSRSYIQLTPTNRATKTPKDLKHSWFLDKFPILDARISIFDCKETNESTQKTVKPIIYQ